MICNLRGILTEKKIDVVTVDVAGVGYEVFIPLKMYSLLPDEGNEVQLHIQTIFKEDGLFLYGFLTRREREVFNFLRLAKGVGVKTAFNLLSSFEEEDLITAIANEDANAILKVPGIGKKTAERIIFELKDKVKKYTSFAVTAKPSDIFMDVELALISLGYSQKDAREAIRIAEASFGSTPSTEEVLKEALKVLVKR